MGKVLEIFTLLVSNSSLAAQKKRPELSALFLFGFLSLALFLYLFFSPYAISFKGGAPRSETCA